MSEDQPQPTFKLVPRPRRRKKLLPLTEDGLRLIADELRQVLARMGTELQGELTAADYARLGALWVRVTEAAIKCELHRALESDRKAKRDRESAGKGLTPEQMLEVETQLRLL